MSQTWTIELYVYLTTALCAVLLLPRGANWRLRLVIGTIGLQALTQSVKEMRVNHPFWQSRLGTTTGIVEMFGGALALTAIYLLKKENRERKSTDGRLRLSEAAECLSGTIPTSYRDRVLPERSSPAIQGVIGADPAAGIAALDASVANNQRSTPRAEMPRPDVEPPHNSSKIHRFPISSAAKVTVLDGPKRILDGIVEDMSRAGAHLRLSESLVPGSLLKMEFRDHLFLGEVYACQESEGRFEVGVHFGHSIDLTHLSQILREIGIEAPGPEAQRESA